MTSKKQAEERMRLRMLIAITGHSKKVVKSFVGADIDLEQLINVTVDEILGIISNECGKYKETQE